MSLISFTLVCLFLTTFCIQPTRCTAPADTQDLEISDIPSEWDIFPSVIDRIKDTVRRLHCPKGWKRLGGSCYYLSNLTSASIDVNNTCNHLHSNVSNLMQIRNAVELFYAVHVLSRNNLTSLMIDIDPSLFKGKNIANLLTNDQGRWQRMKQQLRKVRAKYQNSTKKIVDRLNLAGFRLLIRSSKAKQSFSQHKSNQTTIIISSTVNNTDDEYDDLDSPDETDEFEQIEDIRGICSQIDWNVLNNNSTVFILTTFILSNKTVCSLSDVEPYTEYRHVCEYVLDLCFANIVCGKHGRCVHTLSDIKCSCRFLFGGLYCETISREGLQIVIGFALVIFFSGILYKPVHWAHKKYKKAQIKKYEDANNKEDSGDLVRVPHLLTSPIKSDLARMICVGFLTILFLILIFIAIISRYHILFNIDRFNDTNKHLLINNTIRLMKRCEGLSDYKTGNLIFASFAVLLTLIFSCLVRREKECLGTCDDRPGLIPPIKPFHIGNRYPTATVFGIIAYEVLKIFEELVFGSGQVSSYGVLFELIMKIAIIFIAGLRYYPILVSLHLCNVVARFLACIYILLDIAYAVIREGSCMGFLTLSGKYTILEEANLRMELGTWFIIYGLIKNTPHLLFLSFTGAELCVRFGYDSIYQLIKKINSTEPPRVVHLDESELAKYYLKKLLRRNRPSGQRTARQNTNIDSSVNAREAKQPKKTKQSLFQKIINYIYEWDDDFRFSTMVTCTYTVAFVFLYYLTCTFIFLNISRTTGHVSLLKFYIGSFTNVEFKDTFSLKRDIILSAVFSFLLFAFHLIKGMKNYKKHKLQLYKGLHDVIPRSLDDLKPIEIVTNSVHYSGFLVGYMAWGFVICFHLILAILVGRRILPLQTRHVELTLGIISPVLVIYYLKMALMDLAAKFVFINGVDKDLPLRNSKLYAVLLYFVFFADCFLGIASCISRLIKATLINFLFIARLDHSFMGLQLEKLDTGYNAYVSYLYMEIKETHPVKLAFYYLLIDATHKRPRKYYDEECCTCSSDLHDDGGSEERRENEFRQNRPDSVSNNRRKKSKNDESIQNIIHETHELLPITSAPLHPQENDSSLVSVLGKNLIKNKYNTTDDEGNLSLDEIMSQTKAQNPSAASEKDSQMTDDKKSKQQIPTVSSNEVQVNKNVNSSTSQVSSTTQQQQPQLSKSSIGLTKPSTNQSDDESDADGSLVSKSKSTSSKVIPQQPLHLKTPAQSSKVNTDIPTDLDDEDEDGGVNLKKTIKRKQEAEEKKKKKDELKKKKQAIAAQNLVDEDEDGGIPQPKQKIKQTKTKKKSFFPQCFHNQADDEDGGVSTQKLLAAEKTKPISEAKQEKTQQDTINDSNDNNVLKQQESIKQKKSKRDISESNILQDEDEDEDGGCVIKDYNTIKMIIPPKQPILNNRTAKSKTLSDSTEDGTMRSSKHQRDIPSASYGTISRLVPKISDDILKTKIKKTKDTVPIENELAPQVTITESSSSKFSTSCLNKCTILRRKSYFEAQEHSPPATSQRSKISSSSSGQHNTNDADDSHHSEIKNNRIQSGFINRLYSIIGSLQSSSHHSSRPVSVQTLTENQHTVDIRAAIAKERERIRRRKVARNRWFLAYTFINNPHLSDLRKNEGNRLIYMRSQKSVFIKGIEFTVIDADQEPVYTTIAAEPKALKMQSIPENTATLFKPQPPILLRVVSTPKGNAYQLSSAERYITTRSQMIYDANNEREKNNELPKTIRSISLPQGQRTNILQEENIKPLLFKSISVLNQPTANYQFSAAASSAASSVLCTQKSHNELMKDWYDRRSQKFHKKRRNRYSYGPPPQQSLPDKVSNATILTPSILSEPINEQQLFGSKLN